MVANVQGLSNLYEVYNKSQVINTYVNASQKSGNNEQSNQSASIQPLMSKDEIQDTLHLEHVDAYIQDAVASPNQELVHKEINAWKNINDANNKQQQPLNSQELYKRVAAVNAYKINS